MSDDDFEELLESVKQGGMILRGEMPPSRVSERDERTGEVIQLSPSDFQREMRERHSRAGARRSRSRSAA